MSAQDSFPPQYSRIALYSGGGGFGGALLAIIVARLLEGPCCCAPTPSAGAPVELANPAAAVVLPEAGRS